MDDTNIQKRAHIFEIDLLRAITIFSVVALHSFADTSNLFAKSLQSIKLLALFVHYLHFNREMFIFVTGLVLTYAYYKRPFSLKKFWFRRTVFIVIPYIFWSLIYVKVNNYNLDLWSYIKLSYFDILSGNASYQLYYILLAIEFYLIFPAFLWFLKKIHNFPH
jgi:surface polysaccharide O-acyltransferase-like enzyme